MRSVAVSWVRACAPSFLRARRIGARRASYHRRHMTDVTQVLVDNHARFLAFLAPRLGSPEAAEDVLQAAFVKGLEKQDTLRDEESAVAWFYRLLRNAVTDHHRRRGAEERAIPRAGADHEAGVEDE